MKLLGRRGFVAQACIGALMLSGADAAEPPAPLSSYPYIMPSDNFANNNPMFCLDAMLVATKRGGGKMALVLSIAADGRVSDVTVTNPSGDDDLDRAEKRCAWHLRFQPAKRDGQPVAADYQLNLKWVLDCSGVRVESVSGDDRPADPTVMEQDRLPVCVR